MDRNFFELTPKRKSILWDYQNDGNARIVAIRDEKLKELNDLFNDTIPDLKVTEEDGMGVNLNATGTRIWEECDGLTTIEEIVDTLSAEYGVDKEELARDVEEFMKYCERVNILDVHWRSLV